MVEDGTPRKIQGRDLDDMLPRAFMGLLGASFLMNPATTFTAMQNTIGIAPGGMDMTMAGGISRMMGGMTNTLMNFMPLLGQMQATSTMMQLADPAQQQKPLPSRQTVPGMTPNLTPGGYN